MANNWCKVQWMILKYLAMHPGWNEKADLRQSFIDNGSAVSVRDFQQNLWHLRKKVPSIVIDGERIALATGEVDW